MYRRTYVEIDCDTLAQNVRQITSTYGGYDYYFGVVKANAYGHGLHVLDSLIAGGVNYLAASTLDECLEVRRICPPGMPILCMTPVRPEYASLCAENGIAVTVADIHDYRLLQPRQRLKVHLKVDSGMNRLGFNDPEQFGAVYRDILGRQDLEVEGVFTHFATSGLRDPQWNRQLRRFTEITASIDLSAVKIVHLGRSSTLTTHPKIPFANGIRLGIVMYGFSQSKPQPRGLRRVRDELLAWRHGLSTRYYSNPLALRTAFRLKSEIIAVKRVRRGAPIGYGATCRATDDWTIGVMALGFADGYCRGGTVKIRGKVFPVVGEIGMDLTQVKVDDTVQPGDEVLVYDDITQACRELGVNAYRLLTQVSARVPRVYLSAGRDPVEVRCQYSPQRLI